MFSATIQIIFGLPGLAKVSLFLEELQEVKSRKSIKRDDSLKISFYSVNALINSKNYPGLRLQVILGYYVINSNVEESKLKIIVIA